MFWHGSAQKHRGCLTTEWPFNLIPIDTMLSRIRQIYVNIDKSRSDSL